MNGLMSNYAGAPRLAMVLIAAGSIGVAAWFLGGAMTQGWNSRRGCVPPIALLVLARLAFPLRTKA